MAGGWIKLHRQILDSNLWEKPQTLRFWIWCLLSASYKEAVVNTGFCDVTLAPGQFLYSQSKAITQTSLSGHYVKQAVAYLKKDGALQVKADSTNLFSIATIVKWESYQGQDEENNQPFSSISPADRQAFFGNSTSIQELINKQKNARAYACGEEKSMGENDITPSSVDLCEASFSETRTRILEAWKREREAAGLIYVPTPKNDRAAVAMAAMVDKSQLSLELIETAIRNLMAAPERRNYTLYGLMENLELWVNGGPERAAEPSDSAAAGSKPSAARKPAMPAGSSLRDMRIAQGLDPDGE